MSERACAFVLAGGQGSRLMPFTTVLPKPLIPVCDVPICEIVIRQLRHAGFSRIILAVNRHENLLKSYFGNGSKFDVDITYSRETTPLGTVGPLHLVADRLPEYFLVMNGDLLTDFDYAEFLVAHAASGCDLTIATCRRTHRISDGVIDIDDDGAVVSFHEKPAHHYFVSMGVYAMRRSILERIPKGRPIGMDQLVLSMLGDESRVQTHLHEGPWFDIGCPEDLERAAAAFSERRDDFLPLPDATLEPIG